ncbi:MAG: hypothetical protein ACP5JJ_11510 [Anaerolineae bacterium]
MVIGEAKELGLIVNPIAGLGAYRVQTAVNAAGDVATVVVNVQHPPSGLTLNLESRRGNY